MANPSAWNSLSLLQIVLLNTLDIVLVQHLLHNGWACIPGLFSKWGLPLETFGFSKLYTLTTFWGKMHEIQKHCYSFFRNSDWSKQWRCLQKWFCRVFPGEIPLPQKQLIFFPQQTEPDLKKNKITLHLMGVFFWIFQVSRSCLLQPLASEDEHYWKYSRFHLWCWFLCWVSSCWFSVRPDRWTLCASWLSQFLPPEKEKRKEQFN